MSIPVAAGAALLGGAAVAFVPRVADRLAVPPGAPPRSACAGCGRPFPAGRRGWVHAGATCPCARPPWPTVLGGSVAAGSLAAVTGPSVTLLAAVLGVLLVRVDLRCLRLPDPLVGALAVVVAVPPALRSPAGLGVAVAAAGVVGSAYLLLALAPGGGLGLGDVKLAAVLALGLGFHGWPAVALGVVVPHLLMGPVAAVLLLSRRVRRRAALPFGPALLAGALVATLVTA